VSTQLALLYAVRSVHHQSAVVVSERATPLLAV
jgi:hypothetical protein